MQKKYSVNRIEIVIKVPIEFAAALRAFAAKLLQRRLEPSLLDSQRTKSPLVDVQRQFVPSLLSISSRGKSVPGRPSLTVGRPTWFQKGGTGVPPHPELLGRRPGLCWARDALELWEEGATHSYCP